MHYVLCRILVLVLFSSQLDYEAPTEVHSHFTREQPNHNLSPGICEAIETLQQSLSGKSTAFCNNSPLESLGIYFLFKKNNFIVWGDFTSCDSQFCSPPSPPSYPPFTPAAIPKRLKTKQNIASKQTKPS